MIVKWNNVYLYDSYAWLQTLSYMFIKNNVHFIQLLYAMYPLNKIEYSCENSY